MKAAVSRASLGRNIGAISMDAIGSTIGNTAVSQIADASAASSGVISTSLRTQQMISDVTDRMLPVGLGGVGFGFPETPYSSNAALFGAGSYGAMDSVLSADAADALQASRASSTSALMGLNGPGDLNNMTSAAAQRAYGLTNVQPARQAPRQAPAMAPARAAVAQGPGGSWSSDDIEFLHGVTSQKGGAGTGHAVSAGSLANVRSQSSRETVTGSSQILKEAGNAAAGVWNGVVGIGEFAVNTYVNGLGATSGDPGYLSASALRLPYDGNGQFGPGVEFFAAALATRGGKGTLAEAEAVAVRNGTVGINRINATSYQGEMLGASGAQTASKTVWKGSGRERIDVENPAPGIRPGQIHYQGTDGAKYYYDPNTRSFFDQRTGDLAPRKVQDLVQNSGFSNAIDKALNGYLGAKR